MAKSKAPENRRSPRPKTTPKPKTKSKPKKTQKIPYQLGRKQWLVSHKILREIEMLQHSTRMCLRKLPFSRLCREVTMNLLQRPDMNWQSRALEALQEAAELYLTQLFGDANILAHHAQRLTIKPADMHIALVIRGTSDPGRAD